MKPKTLNALLPRERNPFAAAPIMRKGGVHIRSHKAKRQSDRIALNKKIREDFPAAP